MKKVLLSMVSMKDIARELHLSVSVISRVLNPRPDANARVSAETRRLVQETAERLGYRRSRMGEFLRKGRTPVIGVFIPSYSNSLIANLLLGISEAANEAGLPLSIHSGHTSESYQAFLARQEQSSACGMITYSQRQYNFPELDELIVRYHDHGGKLLVLNDLEENRFPVLAMDEHAGGSQVGNLLLSHSVERIFVLKRLGRKIKGILQQRVAGLQERMDQAGIPVIHSSAEEILDWIAVHPGKCGVFGIEDTVAIGFMNAGAALGLKAGRDYFLCGYDDVDAASLVSPGLSTIHQPFREEGAAAVRMLERLMYGEQVENQLIQPVAVQRETT